MISYPPPKFEQQRSEVFQRYKILRGDHAHDAVCLADTIAMSLRVPYVFVALYKRYREKYFCAHGFTPESIDDIETYFACAHLAQGPFFVEDVAAEEYFTQHAEGLDLPGFKSLAGVPIADPHGKKFGTLCIADDQAREFTQEERRLLAGFGRVVSNDICVRSAAFYAVGDLVQLEKDKCDLFELATLDPLTQALNRRSFEKFAHREFARFQRESSRLAVLMLDIDHFKSVNDTHGHAIGDQVIAKFVSVITKCLRVEDLIGRLGGEEFAVVLVETEGAHAESVANRIRNEIKQVEFPGSTGPFSITVSIGLSEPVPYDQNIACALNRADEALYVAKQTGRDRVVTKLGSDSSADIPMIPAAAVDIETWQPATGDQ